MGGGHEQKPGARSLAQDAFEGRKAPPAIPGKSTLTEQLTPALQTGAGAALVQREADDDAAPRGPGTALERRSSAADAPHRSLDALMRKLTPAWAAALSAGSRSSDAHDNELKAILLGAFEANWFKAKDCLLFDRWPGAERAAHKPPHAASLDLMQALVNMRTRVCNEVARATQLALPAQLRGLAGAPSAGAADDPAQLLAAEANDPDITAEQHATFMDPSGAQKRTSDIDVPIAGRNTEIAVRLFNDLFRAQLKVPFDPATLFDYNTYAQDWMRDDGFAHDQVVMAIELDPKSRAPKPGAQPQRVPTRITPLPEHVISGSANDAAHNAALQQDRAEILDEAALLHIRRNCSEADWRTYAAQRTAAASPTEKNALRTKLRAVDIQYRQFAAAVAKRAQALEPQMSAATAALTSAWGQDNEKFQHEARETRAANELYAERMRTVKDLRLQYRAIDAKHPKTAGDIEHLVTLAKEVTRGLVEASYFANEKYVSEGAVLHTVIGIQKAGGDEQRFGVEIDVVLTKDQYMQSFHENVGDSLYSIEHYRQDAAYATYRAGKYIDRMLRAARGLCGDEVVQYPEYPKLRDLATLAASVKSSDDGDDPARIAPHFATATADTLAALKRSLLAFGTAIPARSAERPRSRKPPDQPPTSKPARQAAHPAMQPATSSIEQLRASVDDVDRHGKKEESP